MSLYKHYAEVLARVTGRDLVREVQPEFCNSSTRDYALDLGFLDAPDMIAAGSCKSSFDAISTPFYISGAFRSETVYF